MYKKYKAFLFTENPDKLVKFYRDILGFKVTNHLTLPRDNGYALEIAPGYEIWLAQHSEVYGKSKETYRHMLNIYVDGIEELYKTICVRAEKLLPVETIQEPICMDQWNPVETRWVFVIKDTDGNALQFMGER